MKIKTILISQPEPSNENSPYSKLQRKHKIKIDFRPFIHVEGLKAKKVRSQKVDFSKFNNIILTSRNAVDHFFRIAEEMRFKVPDQTKYFCQSEAVAFYLQKYVVYRKRKIYVGNNNFNDLESIFQKFIGEKYLVPTSGSLNPKTASILDSYDISWDRVQLYKTVISDLSDLSNVSYDLLVFYSPSGIDSLFKNFPDFVQNKTLIAVYGKTTLQAAIEKNLKVDIEVPTEESRSMAEGIENYINR
ncbi:MAG: uroporphyrinogen-III synthase [Euryarchaeota archaeon]|nr:uroporphyrinogen-III synthase [Euryarchaeota archaeon]|tara:strand:+ start:93 stop:827 length:735 start_codon:yes stop_codon:yes gene_type:complete